MNQKKSFQNREDFNPAMLAGCEAALKADVFYQIDFTKFVLDYMGGPDCKPVLVQIHSIDQDSKDFPKTYVQLIRDIEAEIKLKPRGHYAIIERVGSVSRFSTVISDGTGSIAVGGKFNSYDTKPTGDDVVDSMISYEIYQCRQFAEREESCKKDQEAMEKHHFQVGQSFKGLQSDEFLPTHKFATSTIVEILPNKRIRMSHTKRGSKYIRDGVVSPQLLAKMIQWSGKIENSLTEKTTNAMKLVGDCC